VKGEGLAPFACRVIVICGGTFTFDNSHNIKIEVTLFADSQSGTGLAAGGDCFLLY
jgi:hypothetical protein